MLDGIRVLDLSRVIAGPYCAMMLADLGADVVKVERPGRGDDMRYLGTSKDGMSLGFATINRNKRAIAVDLQHPEGLRIIHELARRAYGPSWPYPLTEAYTTAGLVALSAA